MPDLDPRNQDSVSAHYRQAPRPSQRPLPTERRGAREVGDARSPRPPPSKPLRGPQATEWTNTQGQRDDPTVGSAGARRASRVAGKTPGVARGRLPAENCSPAAGRPRRSRKGHLARKAGAGPASPPRLRLPSPRAPPARAARPSSRLDPRTQKGTSHFSPVPSSFPASIPAPRTRGVGVRPPRDPPGRDGTRAAEPAARTTHLLAGAGLALGRSLEEGGPGGEEEVLGVLLQAAVAAAHAAGPVARRPPSRGAGGQAGGAAPARPARFSARGP